MKLVTSFIWMGKQPRNRSVLQESKLGEGLAQSKVALGNEMNAELWVGEAIKRVSYTTSSARLSFMSFIILFIFILLFFFFNYILYNCLFFLFYMLIPLFCPLHCFFFTYSSLVCCLDKGFFASLLSHIIHTIHILALKGNMFVYNTHTFLPVANMWIFPLFPPKHLRGPLLCTIDLQDNCRRLWNS